MYLKSIIYPEKARAFMRDLLRVGLAVALRLSRTVLTLAFTVMGARLLGTDLFGSYVSLFAVAGLLTVATSIGLPGLVQREISASRGSSDRSALKPLVQGIAVINCAVVVALIAAAISGKAAIAVVLLFCLVGNAAGLLGALFNSYERVLFASWISSLVGPSVALLALWALALLTSPTELLPLLAQIIGAAAIVVTLLLFWHDEPLANSRRALRSAWWSERHSSMMRAGIIFAGTQVLINLTTQIDILILTAMARTEDVAHYYAAVRAAMIVSLFFGFSGMLAEPMLTRLHANGQRGDVQKLARRTALTGAVLTIIAAIAAVGLAPFYLGLYGPGYIAAFPSFCVFTAGLVAFSLFGPAEPLLRATRLELKLLIFTAFSLILNAVLTALLIPFFGMLGAAIGSGVQFAAYGGLLAYALWRRSSYRSDIFFFGKLPANASGEGNIWQESDKP
jgi:O-antigen/teichoic acid export membrane protein